MSDEYCPDCGQRKQPRDMFCRGCGGALTDDARATGPIGEAEMLVERGQLDQAIATVQRAIGASETPELQVALSTLYLRRGGVFEARRAIDRALVLDPRCAVAHAYAGGMAIHAGRADEARERLDRARDLAPDDIIVLMKCAEYWMRLGIYDQARTELKHGLQNGGGTPHVRELAQTMLIAVERRSRNSFTRKTVPLPDLGRFIRVFKRTGKSVPAKAEVSP